MKTINHIIRLKLPGFVLFTALVLACGQAEAVSGRVATTDKQVIKASSIRYKKADQTYIITTEGVERPLAKSKVAKLDIDRPASYDQAVAILNSGKVEEAITALEGVYAECIMLPPWDAQALDLLGRIYTSKKPDKALAVSTYKKLLNNAHPDGITADIKKRAWNVLIANNDYKEVLAEIEKTISNPSVSRSVAAAAYMARGDLARQLKNTPDAFIDYMRIVLLFDQVKDLQPEAMYKAMKCMEELKDTRAGELRRELAQKYPQSEYASKE